MRSGIVSLMPTTATFRESRRSSRVPLKVVISIEGGAESRTCEGETIIVNLHRSLIATAKAPEGTGIGHCASVLGTDGTFEDLTAQMFQFRGSQIKVGLQANSGSRLAHLLISHPGETVIRAVP